MLGPHERKVQQCTRSARQTSLVWDCISEASSWKDQRTGTQSKEEREDTREKRNAHLPQPNQSTFPQADFQNANQRVAAQRQLYYRKVVTSVFAPPAVFAESVSYQCLCKFTHRVPTQTFTTDVEHGPFERKKGARRHAGRTTSTIPASHDSTCCSARPPAGTQPTPHDTNSQRRTVTHRGTKHPHMITRNCAL